MSVSTQPSPEAAEMVPLTDLRGLPVVEPDNLSDAPDIRVQGLVETLPVATTSLLDRAKRQAGTTIAIANRGSYAIKKEQEAEAAKEQAKAWIDSLDINPDETFKAALIEDKPDGYDLVGDKEEDQPREIILEFDPKSRVLDIKDCIRPDFWYNGGHSLAHNSFELTFDWEGKVTDINGTLYDDRGSWYLPREDYHEEPVPFSELDPYTALDIWNDTVGELKKVKTGIISGHTEVFQAGAEVKGSTSPVVLQRGDPKYEYEQSNDPHTAYWQGENVKFARKERSFGRRMMALILAAGTLATGLAAAEGNGVLETVGSAGGVVASATSLRNLSEIKARNAVAAAREAGQSEGYEPQHYRVINTSRGSFKILLPKNPHTVTEK